MRTTLTIDDDVLQAAKETARRERRTTGQVISDTCRTAISDRRRAGLDLANRGKAQPPAGEADRRLAARGFVILPGGQHLVTDEDVNRLRDGLGI